MALDGYCCYRLIFMISSEASISTLQLVQPRLIATRLANDFLVLSAIVNSQQHRTCADDEKHGTIDPVSCGITPGCLIGLVDPNTWNLAYTGSNADIQCNGESCGRSIPHV